MKSFLFFIALLSSLVCFSQVTDTAANRWTDTSSVTVHKDPRLDLLVKKQIQINEETTREARKSGKGYRLMIISTSNRDEAIAAKTKVYTYFPELKAYLWHQSPYYKLKAGNFKERKDAEAYQKKLNAYFPKGVFIMNDIVELRSDKNSEENL
ncbi:MAG TPA: SPOR domain-containing protein [Chitinophagaceae bacterium]|nr:SPOR domain-containing protein [Chitinophagaceae bacterium]